MQKCITCDCIFFSKSDKKYIKKHNIVCPLFYKSKKVFNAPIVVCPYCGYYNSPKQIIRKSPFFG